MGYEKFKGCLKGHEWKVDLGCSLAQDKDRPIEPQSKGEDMPFTTWQLHENLTSSNTKYEANVRGRSDSTGGSQLGVGRNGIGKV